MWKFPESEVLDSVLDTIEVTGKGAGVESAREETEDLIAVESCSSSFLILCLKDSTLSGATNSFAGGNLVKSFDDDGAGYVVTLNLKMRNGLN